MAIGHVESFVQSWLPFGSRLAPVSYKDSGVKLLFTFQVWARLFCRSMYFLFSYFHTYCMNVSHAISDDIKHFQQAEPEHNFDYTNWRLHFFSWSPKGDLTILILSPVSCNSCQGHSPSKLSHIEMKSK